MGDVRLCQAFSGLFLLKNEGGILLLRDKRRIAVIGSNAGVFRPLFESYTYSAFYAGRRKVLLGTAESMGGKGLKRRRSKIHFAPNIMKTRLLLIGFPMKAQQSGFSSSEEF
jgi:beta-glucosidase-like glycosyl hydrolase